MTSSDLQKARGLLQVIVAALDPAAVKKVIDAPIETAAEKLLCGTPQPSSCEEFNSRMCDFVRQIYLEASLTKRILSCGEAFAVGVQLLNDGYGADDRKGYEFALLDVLQRGSQEMDIVLRIVMEAIKAREQSSYVKWVCGRYLESLQWPIKCALAEEIREAHKNGNGEHLLKGTAVCLAVHLSDLVESHLKTVHATWDCAVPAQTVSAR